MPNYLILLLSFLISLSAQARIFHTSYVSFELPDRWQCQLDGTEYVCRAAGNTQDSREAIIILTAKEVGPTDSLVAYEGHLKTPKTIMNRLGQPVVSEVKKVETIQINNHPWIDSTHLNSEIFNYFTRYVATVKDRLAIGITFSAHKLHFAKYSNDFIKAVQSLQIIATPGMWQGDPNPMGASGGQIGVDPGPLPVDPGMTDPLSEPVPESGGSSAIVGLAIVVAAIALYLLIKLNSKKKK